MPVCKRLKVRETVIRKNRVDSCHRAPVICYISVLRLYTPRGVPSKCLALGTVKTGDNDLFPAVRTGVYRIILKT